MKLSKYIIHAALVNAVEGYLQILVDTTARLSKHAAVGEQTTASVSVTRPLSMVCGRRSMTRKGPDMMRWTNHIALSSVHSGENSNGFSWSTLNVSFLSLTQYERLACIYTHKEYILN